ncbi:TVP38/TMEM64 family protein [Candidatus Peregrinibacteria bacterium]|nr:TVP38/TMEM64 family protein [Candidatus Peregrinibacteria bacterium]
MTIDNFQLHETAIFNFVENNYIFTVIIFFLISSLFVNSPIPFATALELIGGYLFGFAHGVVFNIVAMILGSVTGYFIASYIFHDFIQIKLIKNLKSLRSRISKHGISYLISLRFSLAVPYFFINYAAGSAKMPFYKFLISTIIGVVPSAVIYAYGGSTIREIGTMDDLFRPRIILIIILLVIFSLMPVWFRLIKERKSVK